MQEDEDGDVVGRVRGEKGRGGGGCSWQGKKRKGRGVAGRARGGGNGEFRYNRQEAEKASSLKTGAIYEHGRAPTP